MTEARLEEEVNRLSEAVEKHLQAFQRDLIGGTQRANLVWNVVNVVLSVLLEEGVITPETVTKYGEKLWDVSMRNHSLAKVAAKTNIKPVFEKTPLDTMTDIMSAIHEKKKQEKEQEHDQEGKRVDEGQAGGEGDGAGTPRGGED